jgi:hypothetical protein
MADERYTLLYNKLKGKYGLSTVDVSDIKMGELFEMVLKIYSRFRGIRDVQTITFAESTLDYELDGAVHHIMAVYWNDTYPEELTGFVASSESIISEQYHHPALIIIDKWKQAMSRQLRDKTLYEWRDYEDDDTHMIHVNIQPTTNILVEYRKLFTKTDYPRNDEDLLEVLLEAHLLRFLLGVPQITSHGDMRFNIDGMIKLIKELESDFYNTIRTVKIGRS